MRHCCFSSSHCHLAMAGWGGEGVWGEGGGREAKRGREGDGAVWERGREEKVIQRELLDNWMPHCQPHPNEEAVLCTCTQALCTHNTQLLYVHVLQLQLHSSN